jgi:4'-phosphopantetheinyl transferase
MHPLSGHGLTWTRHLPCGVEVFAFGISTGRTKHDSEILSAEERERATAMTSGEARERFVRSRIALRHTLAWLGATAPGRLDIFVDPNGKPHLRQSSKVPALEFSMSHSGSTLAIAVTHDGPVGVDIEELDSNVDVEAIANRFFPPAEVRTLRNLDSEERREAFFRAWVRKEAVAKATDLGLDSALASVDLTGATEDGRDRRIELADRHVLVTDLPAFAGVVGAVAIETVSA